MERSKIPRPILSFVQLHGTGRRQIVRQVTHADQRHMTDRGLLKLYESPDPEQVTGSRVGEIMERVHMG